MKQRFVIRIAAPAALLALGAHLGCADGEERDPVRPPDSLPESVSVPAGQVQVGTASGTLRKQVAVQAFSVSRFPITVKQYRECVAARACSAPARTAGQCRSAPDKGGLGTYSGEPGVRDELPATCTTPKQAEAFCQWVGGRLPRIEEWFHAARGPDVRKYSWSGEALSCKLHAGAAALFGSESCCGASCKLEDVLGVGRHPDGKSPLGIEDVLITPAELVAASKDAAMPACRASKTGCLATTTSFASIDAVLPAPEDPAVGAALLPWSFRCVWSEKGGTP